MGEGSTGGVFITTNCNSNATSSEHRQRFEQARIDRLLDEAESLRRAMDICAYVDAVKNIFVRETTSISAAAMEQWAKWALAKADRIDPVRSARFLDTFDEKGDAN